MIDLKWLREEPELFRAGARKKRIACDIDAVLALDARSRELQRTVEELRTKQNSFGKLVAKAAGDEKAKLLAELSELKASLKDSEAAWDGLKKEIDAGLLRIPQPPAAEVPEGKDDTENKELKRVGEPTRFSFEPRDHVALAEGQGWIDFERAARIAGSRNYVLIGELALLELGLMRFALDHMVGKGFVPLSVPVLVRSQCMVGTGYFPGGEEQAYRCDERDDLVLAGTAEVPVTSFHAGEILGESDLPKRYVALSSCYRREAGTYGKDTRGLYRVHQFQKVEQVVVDVADTERSLAHHREILANAEEVLQALEIPYRVVDVCGGDLGAGQVQKFDIESWMPSRKGWGETHSASRFHEYQSRRLELRYRDAQGKVRYCHTLNNTVAASARLLICVLENHQQADGRVRVPKPLVPYLGGREMLGRAL
ncbi:MAG: serine--tRNA ligase [Planctomycetota bacterium]|nr:MAG: serine--tRNA ligase [Planctomycetota bacterium]